jgi:putative beta-lysine N-acetyltransferase
MIGWTAAAMPDRQEYLGGSLIQHGRHSDRIYLMHLAPADVPWILEPLADLAMRSGYGKIFAKVPADLSGPFLAAGYEQEAAIPGFFRTQDGLFLARYFDAARRSPTDQEEISAILAACRQQPLKPHPAGTGYHLRRCRRDEVEVMAALFREIFHSYPFPIDDPAYLKKTLASHVTYFGAWRGKELAALASAEQAPESGHVEMTDFATRPSHRRQGLAAALLAVMDEAMRQVGFRVAYTIARAASPGMNFTFSGAGYCFGGTLINNTQIGGRIESMNVWYKDLRRAKSTCC